MIISREKEAHFITRIIPIKILKQLFAKISFGYILNLTMIITTMLIVTSFGYITIVEGVVVFLLSVIFSTGYTVILISSDYENPQLTTNVGGFEEGLNMYKNLFMGLFLSIIVGVVFSVTPFIRKLFESRRVFSIFDNIVIIITADTINYMLYGTILFIIITYFLLSLLRLRKVVKEK